MNGRHDLAREQIDDLVDGIVAAVEAIQDAERVEPSLGSWYAADMLKIGRVDEAESIAAAEERARKTIMNELRPVGRPHRLDQLERAGRKVSLEAWRQTYDELRDDAWSSAATRSS